MCLGEIELFFEKEVKMVDLSKIFEVFENFETVTERTNSKHDIPTTNLDEDIYKRIIRIEGGQTLRYILVKLVEERFKSHKIFGGANPFTDKQTPPMENPPKTAVIRKNWEKASYLVRFSNSNTHLGIAGSVMETLEEKVPTCKLCLHQSGHGEPAIIAKTDNIYDYATVIGAGFAHFNPDKNEILLYGRSRSFTVNYEFQVKYYLGMTGHEFVAKILQSELPEWRNIIIVNNDAESSVEKGCEYCPSPK